MRTINFCIPRGIKLLNCESFWEHGYYGQNIKVAVIDSGCDINHVCLSDRIIGCKNFTTEGGDNDVTDHYAHGTHITGIIGANGCDGGIIGVAPKCELFIVKVLNKRGETGTSEFLNAINYAIRLNVDIINISISGKYDSPILHNTIMEAKDNNIMVVCASGNNPKEDLKSELYYPGAYKECIDVGATNFEGRVLKFSNPSTSVDLVCYGANITSTYPNNKYAKCSGTSQASPFVSGTLALLKCYFVDVYKRPPTYQELYNLLISYTNEIENTDKLLQGNGLLRLEWRG